MKMYKITLFLSIVSFLAGRVLSNRNDFICQCYCSLSEYIFKYGKFNLNSVNYVVDIKPIILNGSGRDGVLEFSNSQPNLTSENGLIREYRTGTLALWNSANNLKQLSFFDHPEGNYSISSLYAPFEEIFMDVNRVSKPVMSLNSDPAILVFKNENSFLDDSEYQQKYCEKACQRPISSLKQYSYSKTEFVELSKGGNIFNQYPARDSDYYPNLSESIRKNSGKGQCKDLASSLTGIETSWTNLYDEIRRMKNNENSKKEFIKKYPVVSRQVSEPVAVELTSSSSAEYMNSTYSRVRSFEKYMRETFQTNIVKFPDNTPSTLEQRLSPLFQFRAKLVLKNGNWKVDKMYMGSGTHFQDFSGEFLNLLLSKNEIGNLLSNQKDVIEKWAEKFWDLETDEKYSIPSAPLESIEQISKEGSLDKLEEWINEKERVSSILEGNLPISLLNMRLSKDRSILQHGKIFDGSNFDDTDKLSMKEDQDEQEYQETKSYVEELHIIYYGLLTLNCFTQQMGNIGNNMYLSSIVFNVFPDLILRRDSDNSFAKIQIPKSAKKWTNISILSEFNAIDHLIRSSSYSFALQLSKYNPQLYLVLFRDLKHVLSYNNQEIFSRNTCAIPKNKHHVEVVNENEDIFQKPISTIFSSDPFRNSSEMKVRFTDVNHFNLLKDTMSKCLGILPPVARVRVNEHFKNRYSVVSDYVCAIDHEKETYLLQLYSRHNVNQSL